MGTKEPKGARINGRFAPGYRPPGSGKKKGSVGGRAGALAILDELLAETSNRKHLKRKLQENFRADTVGFFKGIVMPLIPREQLVKVQQNERAPVRIILDADGAASFVRKHEKELADDAE